MGAEPEVLPGARAYLRIIFLALPFQTASAMFSAVLRCMGDTKTPLLFNTAGNLLNVALNFLFIYPTRTITLFGSSFTMWGADWGVAGAALATAISTALVGTALLGCVFLREGDYRIRLRESFRPERGIIRRALRIGLPVGLERATISWRPAGHDQGSGLYGYGGPGCQPCGRYGGGPVLPARLWHLLCVHHAVGQCMGPGGRI